MAVRATVPVSDGQSQSFLGYLDIPESMVSQFRIGQLISVAVPTALPAEQFIVPRDALVLGDQQIRVFVLDEEGRARAIPVTVGAGHGDYVAVEGSLAAGQQVIVRGAESIRSGDRVIRAVAGVVSGNNTQQLIAGGRIACPRRQAIEQFTESAIPLEAAGSADRH